MMKQPNRFRALCAAVFLTQIILLGQAAGAGAALNVPQDHPTIQAAIDAAQPGDTIDIAAGTYPESLSISKHLALRPASGAGEVVVSSPTAETGILVEGGARVTLTNMTVREFAGTGVRVQGGAFLAMTQCTVSNNQARGLEVTGNGRAFVRKAMFSGQGKEAVVSREGSEVWIEDSEITGNGTGLRVEGGLLDGSNNLFKDNGRDLEGVTRQVARATKPSLNVRLDPRLGSTLIAQLKPQEDRSTERIQVVNVAVALLPGKYTLTLEGIPGVKGNIPWGEVSVGGEETLLPIDSGIEIADLTARVKRWRVTPVDAGEGAKVKPFEIKGSTPGVPLPPGRYQVAARIGLGKFIDLTPAQGIEVAKDTVVTVDVDALVPAASEPFRVRAVRKQASPGETVPLEVSLPAAAFGRLLVLSVDRQWRYAPTWTFERAPKTAAAIAGKVEFPLPADAPPGEYFVFLEWLSAENEPSERLAITMDSFRVAEKNASAEIVAIPPATPEAPPASCPRTVTVSGHLKRQGQPLIVTGEEYPVVTLQRTGSFTRVRTVVPDGGAFELSVSPGRYILFGRILDGEGRMASAPGQVIDVGCDGLKDLELSLSASEAFTPEVEPEPSSWRWPSLVSSAWAQCQLPEPGAEECPCGKMPVCVMSGMWLGSFMTEAFSGGEMKLSEWKGFGITWGRRLGNALTAEAMLTQALQQANPCLDVISVDADNAMALSDIMERVEKLTNEMSRLIECGGGVSLPETQRYNCAHQMSPEDQLNYAYKEEELRRLVKQAEAAGLQSMFSFASCPARIMLGGKNPLRAPPTVSARLVGEEGFHDLDSSASQEVKPGWDERIAKDLGSELEGMRKKLFCECEKTSGYCITTEFDLGDQQHRCEATVECCGEVTNRFSEEGFGIRAGGGQTYVRKCCGEGTKEFGPDSGSGEGEQGRKKVVRCPGTDILRARDLDCDGLPNARDPSPLPSLEEIEKVQ